MKIAAVAATRSTCMRKHVGAVIVGVDNAVISTGYNGSLRGAPHCDDVGCNIVNGHCIATVHAELNAILSAAARGQSTKLCTLYTTTFPCLNCYKACYQAGISQIIYKDIYNPDPLVISTEKLRLHHLNTKWATDINIPFKGEINDRD